MSGFPECDRIANQVDRDKCIRKAKGQTPTSLETLFRELDKCDQMGGQWRSWCKDQVRQRWIQNMIGPRIYPWNNFRWDYQQYVKNNYDPVKLGLDKKDTSTTALIRNIGILLKLVNGLLSDPNPNQDSIAGVSDQPEPNSPIYAQYIELRRQILELRADPVANAGQIKALRDTIDYLERSRQLTAKEYGLATNYEGTLDNPPYADPFFNKPIKGKSSSSYFIQTGFCKTKDNTRETCTGKGYEWIGDQCYRGKYVYLDNAPGLKVGYIQHLEGLIPSLINDVSQINPTNYMGMLQGYSVPGLEIQQCPEDNTIESFIGERSQISYSVIAWILLVGLVMYLIYIPKL